jgi:uncharacterized membrane protein
VLLFRGRFLDTKPLSQIQRSTLWPLQDADPTPSFGGFGLNWRLNWPVYMASLGMVITITSFAIIASGFKAGHNGPLITGLILYLVSAIIWIITIAAIIIVLITRTIQSGNNDRARSQERVLYSKTFSPKANLTF